MRSSHEIRQQRSLTAAIRSSSQHSPESARMQVQEDFVRASIFHMFHVPDTAA